MRKLSAAAAFAAGLAILAGCGNNDSSITPTADENLQLNNAAEMLDASADGMTASEDTPLGNGEEAIVEPDDPALANEAAANSAENAQ